MNSDKKLNRRNIIRMGLVAFGVTTLFGVKGMTETVIADSVLQKNRNFAGDKGAQLDPALVQDFVRLSHFDFQSVKSMVEEKPELAVASWDWGGGDFETGLGAASHVGNKDIALYLIENGARPDIFSAAMLGQLDVVKGLVSAYPKLKNCKGPHGLSLIHHAEKGGEDAQKVLDYLNSI